jgi:hypothetical protein
MNQGFKWSGWINNGFYDDDIDDYTSTLCGERGEYGEYSEYVVFGVIPEQKSNRYFGHYNYIGSCQDPVTFKVPQNDDFLSWSSHDIERFVRGSGVRFGDVSKLHKFLEKHAMRVELRENTRLALTNSPIFNRVPLDLFSTILTFA